jgi:hypothetical protein
MGEPCCSTGAPRALAAVQLNWHSPALPIRYNHRKERDKKT